jgi:hypothetical protein
MSLQAVQAHNNISEYHFHTDSNIFTRRIAKYFGNTRFLQI